MSDLWSIILGGETKYIEFKEKYSKSLLKTISAYSNYHDGKIIIGITDDGLVVGVEDSKQLRHNIENTINDSIRPRPDYEIDVRFVENREVLIIKIYKGQYTPYVLERKAYKRSDTSTIGVDKLEYDELVLLGRNLTFEELPYQGTMASFNKLGQLLNDRMHIHVLSDDILKSMELLKGADYNNAAALLADQNKFVDVGMDFVKYGDDKMTILKDRMTLSGVSIIECFDTAMLFYQKHINKGDIIKGIYRESREEVPETAYREAIANAIIHRDYSRRGNNRVEIFEDRIEITSIGSLPVGISKEEYLNGNFSNVRNRIVADVFLRCKIIEKMGTGIRRIKNAYRDYPVKPIFKVFDNSIQIILPIVKMEELEKPFIIKEATLTLEEERALNFIKGSGSINRMALESIMNIKKTKATALLNDLIKKGVIVKYGSGKGIKYKIR